MRFVSLAIHVLDIPFVESFRHSLYERSRSDAVVVRVVDELGNEGFGEGLPRDYVTGETSSSMIDRLHTVFWPAIHKRDLPNAASLQEIDGWLPEISRTNEISDGSARAAMSLAITDCILKRNSMSLSDIMAPVREQVMYSGIITASSIDKAAQSVEHYLRIGISTLKVKVGFPNDEERLHAIRDAAGPDANIRLDANGAWSPSEAIEMIARLSACNISTVEQPVARGDIADLIRVKQNSNVQIMADESVITVADAQTLAEQQAVDLFNIRVSKCGGLHRSLKIAEIAAQNGIGIQIGSQVGETAILSAAGRALSAAIPDIIWNEGSFGTLLLSEDVCIEAIRFGFKGHAPVLRGLGLGIRVLRERLEKYETEFIVR